LLLAYVLFEAPSSPIAPSYLGNSCRVKYDAAIYPHNISIIIITQVDSLDLNGKYEYYRRLNLTLTAVYTDEANFWIVDENRYAPTFISIFVIAYIVVVFFALYKLVAHIRSVERPFELSVMTVCLLDIIVVNIFRIVYFLCGPFYMLSVLDSRVSTVLIIVPWPFGVFILFLIALYWEELIRDSFKSRSFIEKYRKAWVVFCSTVLGLDIVLLLLVATTQNIAQFYLYVSVISYVQIGLGSLSIVYCIANTIRISQMIARFAKKELSSLKWTSYSIMSANFGMLAFIVAVVMVTLGMDSNSTTYWYTWGLLQMGQLICDFGVLNSFYSSGARIPSS